MNLLQSSKQGKYCGAIHNIGLLEFFVFIGVPNNNCCVTHKTRKILSFMTIDATESVIERHSKYEPPIFLYQCVCVDSEKYSNFSNDFSGL